MQKQQVMLVVSALFQDMKDLTIQSGVTEDQYQAVLEFADQATVSDLMELHTWLNDLRISEYDDVLKVWERHPPETWKMYETMEIFHLAEQKLLRRKYKLLREVWKDCPYVVKKKKVKSPKHHNIEEGSSEMSIQSETTGTDENNS